MKIFVTGGTGYIGSHVLQKLIETGYSEIDVLTRKNISNQKYLKYIQGDIRDKSSFLDYVTQADIVVHLAGCKKNLQLQTQTNVEGTKNVIDACRQNGQLKKLIYLSSVGVIGAGGAKVIDERTACCPENGYEKSKYKAELIVKEYSKNNPNKVIILRPTNVFGENDPERHLLNLIKKIQDNWFRFVGADSSKFYLNYLYVREISELVPRLFYAKTNNDLYILGTPIKLHEFIMIIKKILNDETPIKHLPYLPLRVAAHLLDMAPKKYQLINSIKLKELTNERQYISALLSKDLAWAPKYEMERALINLVGFYKNKSLL